MRLQTKIGLSILPLVVAFIVFLGVWSVRTAERGIEQSTSHYMEMVLDSFVQEKVVFHYNLLQRNGLEKVDSYVLQYQQRVINAAPEIEKTVAQDYENAHLFALNESGKFLFCSRHEGVSHPAWAKIAMQIARNSEVDPKGVLNTGSGLEHYVAYHFKPWGWVIFVAVADREIRMATAKIRTATLGIALLCIFGCSLLIIAVFRIFFVNPLAELQKGIQRIGAGNLDFKVATNGSNDEIGQLGQSFDRMTADLKRVMTSRDELETEIQERKKAEEALLNSKKILDEAQRIAHLGVWELDLSKNELLWSDEIYRIFGLRPQEFEATYEAFVKRIHPEDRLAVNTAYTQAVKERKPYEITHRIIRPDGTIRIVHEKCEHYFDHGSGEVIRSIGTVHDITEQIEIENELKKHRDHLEELVKKRTTELAEAYGRLQEMDRMKSMFIASMSHELRTPLNSIIGFTRVVLDGMSGEINDQQRDQLGRVARSSEHLLALVSDVIDISNIEAGRITVVPREIVLRDLVVEAVDQVKGAAEKKSLLLSTDIPADLAMVTDQKRLRQCLVNLLSNAVKFSEHGVIKVTARRQDDWVQIAVNDAGIGIAKNDTMKIFKPFERLQTHLTVKAGGTGLGLYLTQKLVTEILHGELEVESEVGKGSTFWLKIPKRINEQVLLI